MDMPDKEQLTKIVRRLQNARLELMKEQPFYAVLLLHMKFSIDLMAETLYTDGERIAFQPEFVDMLSDQELKFVLMHEVLHAALDHCGRTLKEYQYDEFNTACDIVVNSNIMHSLGDDENAISLKEFGGPAMHKAPDGKEGYEYTVEEVYKLVMAKAAANAESDGDGDGDSDDSENTDGEGDDSEGGDDDKDDSDENGNSDDESNDGDNNKDSDADGNGNHDGKNSRKKNGKGSGKGSGNTGPGGRTDGGFDDHTFWNGGEEEGEADGSDVNMKDIWLQRMVEATDIVGNLSIAGGSHTWGSIPVCADRIIRDLLEPQTDWRTVLENFIQEEINDYSFNPPDRRFQDSPFLLPDFNEKDESVQNILFMVDTSGSMSDRQITQAYSEIKGAIDQFDGHLSGYLGFFDAVVVEPKPFASEEEFRIIRPKGGGGTSFDIIFDYVKEKMQDNPPVSIVILTDGYAPFPKEEAAMDIPVLWIINKEDVTPPWGKVARIKDET